MLTLKMQPTQLFFGVSMMLFQGVRFIPALKGLGFSLPLDPDAIKRKPEGFRRWTEKEDVLEQHIRKILKRKPPLC